MAQQREIYRQESLDKLASPDRLDSLLRIVKPQTWITVGAFGVGLALVVVWSLLGRIPDTAEGAAMLVRPKQVVSFQAPSGGQLASIAVGVGDMVARGDVLASLDLPTLEKQLDQERARLAEFRLKTTELTALERELAEREKAHLGQQRALIERRVGDIELSAERYKSKSDGYIAQQRASLSTAVGLTEEMDDALAGRYEAYRELRDGGLVSEDRVVDMNSLLIENRLRSADLDVKTHALNLQENLAQETYDGQMDLVKDLRIQLNDLDLRVMVIDQRLQEEALENKSEVQSIQRRIGELEVQLSNEGRVVSEHDGRVLELTMSAGQHVAVGQRLGKLEIEDPDAELMVLAYFEVKDGKRVRPGLKMRVSPATVERERHGAIICTVLQVSDYPVTTDAAANQIGDVALTRVLMNDQSRIEVLARLEVDPTSHTGYAWTSGTGPQDILVTAGTTARCRVTITERAPISLVFPFLRSLSGI